MGIDIERVYQRYGPLVYRRCLRLLGSEASAEEAMHDVFVRLLLKEVTSRTAGSRACCFRWLPA